MAGVASLPHVNGAIQFRPPAPEENKTETLMVLMRAKKKTSRVQGHGRREVRRSPRHPAGAAPADQAHAAHDHTPHPATREATAPFTQEEEGRFTQFYHDHVGWALCQARLWGATDPEFVVNGAMCAALLKFDPSRGSFPSLLWCILRHACINARRRERVPREFLVPLSDDFEIADPTALCAWPRAQLREELHFILSLLSAEDRQLISLKYEEDLTLAEILDRL